MKAAPESFRAFDIRGVVPDQIDADLAEQVGRAFVAEVQPSTVVVSRDVRITGPEFHRRLVQGLTKAGAEVIDLGVASTDQFYFACASKDLPGITITASHNPPEFNGFKMIKRMPLMMVAKDFRPAVVNRQYADSPTPGSVTETSVTDQFMDLMLKLVPASSLKPLKVAVDTSDGCQGAVWERLAPKLPITVIPLSFKADGRFPSHPPDIVQPAAQENVRAKVKETGADLGLIFDPDGDRCLVVDDSGQSVSGDFMTALLGVDLLKRQPGATVLYDIRSTDAIPDLVTKAGGQPYLWMPGHVNIKPEMKKRRIAFGGELSGHYYFEDFWFADCGMLSALHILRYVSGLGRPLSGVVDELRQKYFLSGEINSSVKDFEGTLQRVRERYADGELNELAGVAVRYPNWHFDVRPSDNEPLMRLTVEATSQALMEEKRDELLALIRS